MEFRNLGDSGLKVSTVGLGCNNFGMRIDADQTKAVVHAALDAGINFFDTADVYGGQKSEVFLGQTASAPATSTSISSTGRIRTRPSRKRCGHWTIW